MEGKNGRNRTPDKLPSAEREPLYEACSEALAQMVDLLQPKMVLGVGNFAEKRARDVVGGRVAIGRVLHPSPASPAANRGWAQAAEKQLTALGLLGP
jgi:single-strand selective monofunctional uracil DNA glycosylase